MCSCFAESCRGNEPKHEKTASLLDTLSTSAAVDMPLLSPAETNDVISSTYSDEKQCLHDQKGVSETKQPQGMVQDNSLSTKNSQLKSGTEITPDYSVVLGEGKSVRNYQIELAQPGIEGKNYIVIAPTGSGKTLVAALIISNHLQEGKNKDEDRQIVFIVEKRPLAQQQTKELQNFIPSAKVSCCIGDDSNNRIKSSMENGHNIIVCTAGKLLDDQNHGRISLSDFSLVIFDECHHTRKKSPYAELMITFIEHKLRGEEVKLPQVVGLTASPGAGDNPNLEKIVTIDHLVNLCALMDATSGMKMVQTHKEELSVHTNTPDYTVENSKDRDQDEPFVLKVVTLMQKLEKMVDFVSSFNRWSQKYETQIQQKKYELEKNADPKSRDTIRILEFLRTLNRALDVYMELQYEDAMSVLEDSSLCKLKTANKFDRELGADLNNLVGELKVLDRVENPHLGKVQKILELQFESDRNSKVMLFVRTKKHASSIFNWVKSLPVAESLEIKPCMVVGQEAGTTGDGMTQAEQENSFEMFRDGRSNVLVVTSIGEEGIDVPACNLVIRYQHVSNEIAKAQTLGRARATGRSEGFTILSSSSTKNNQEMKNGELLTLVDTILMDAHFPTGRNLQKRIDREQENIVKKKNDERVLKSERKSTYEVEAIDLLCATCKEHACCAADIRVLNGTCYVVPSKEFESKINLTNHPKPEHKLAMNKTHKINCKECGHSWGSSCIWPNDGMQFPVLSCKSFTFYANGKYIDGKWHGKHINVKKWSEAPFTIKEF